MAASDPILSPIQFSIAGPRGFGSPTPSAIWTAQAQLLAWTTQTGATESPWLNAAARNLFVHSPKTAGQTGVRLQPGLILARCRIQEAQVNLGGVQYELTSSDGSAFVDAVLLLEARSDKWGQLDGSTDQLIPGPIDDSGIQFRCVGGEFSAEVFTQISGAARTAGAPPPWAPQFPMLSAVQNLNLTAGGLAIEGRATFPWRAAPISNARYLVQVQLAPPPSAPSAPLLVICDGERLSDYAPAASDLIAAFTQLATLLAPTTSATDPSRRLKWFGLEPANLGALPDFSWDLFPAAAPDAKATYALRLDNGWRLYLTDQPPRPPGANGLDPLGVLSANPVLKITGGGTTALTVAIASAGPAANPLASAGPTAAYTFDSGRPVVENLTLANITTVYDAVAVAQILRAQYGVAAPDSDPLDSGPPTAVGIPAPGTPESASNDIPGILWAFLPLEDGWAQLPVVNLTEQMILDEIPPSLVAIPLSAAATTLLTGAASFGNDRPELYPLTGGTEQPWNLTVSDAVNFDGQMTLTGGGTADNWVVSKVRLSLYGPELNLDGFFWVGLTPPTADDALPDLGNWLSGLQRISLRTLRDLETFPSPFLINFDVIGFNRGTPGSKSEVTASLADWQFSYAANNSPPSSNPTGNPVFVTLWPKDDKNEPLWINLPLVWRRHPSAPTVQSLPMTQTATPPNYPSPSRQLAPLQLPVASGLPSGWTFHSTGATAWPMLVTNESAAVEWASQGGLPLASLGLPGLVFDPTVEPGLIAQDPKLTFLQAQYRFGLPYLDEVHALSTLPRNDPNSGVTTDNLPPPTLLRENYADHWSRLSTLAFFAATDADELLAPKDGSDAKNGVVGAGLFEPFLWPVAVSLDASAYPGKLTFRDSGSSQTMTLSSDLASDALRGLDGLFTVDSGSLRFLPPPASGTPAPTGSFAVVAGSVGATVDGQKRLRDQRGLWRNASVVGAASAVIKTDLQLEGGDAVRLYSALASIELDLGAGAPWRFWFRDVPTTAATAPTTGFKFDRAQLPASVQRRGANDPAAMSRPLVDRTGYEWRLGGDGAAAATPEDVVLKLGPLHFCPLELTAVSFAKDDTVSGLEIAGLLQLPLPGSTLDLPRPELGNAVRLIFAGAPLTLQQIVIKPTELDPGMPVGTAPPALGHWPLDSQTDSDVNPPVIRWDEVLYDAGAHTVTLNATLAFFAHGVFWTVSAPKLSISLLSTPTHEVYPFGSASDLATAAVVPVSATLDLEFSSSNSYSLLMDWQFRWGDPKQVNLVLKFEEALLENTLPPAAATAMFCNASPSFALNLDVRSTVASLDEGAFVVQFGVTASDDLVKHQFLPGMHLANEKDAVNGFAALTFTISETTTIPTFTAGTGHLEAILHCDWGTPLQQAVLGKPASPLDPIYGSSSGQLAVSYTMNLASLTAGSPSQWQTQIVFNGMLEVKNLISWPTSLQAAPTSADQDNLFVLPGAHPNGSTFPPLHHARHTARILFNQYTEVGGSGGPFVCSSDPFTFFEIPAPTTAGDSANGLVWQPLAVVEHQIVNIADENSGAVPTIGSEIRWTTTQEVRFCAPATFAAFLTELSSDSTVVAPGPGFDDLNAWTATTLSFADSGYHTTAILRELADPENTGANPALNNDGQGPLMIVEASVHSLLFSTAVNEPPETNLQHLPFGTQQAMLAPPPNDVAPVSPPNGARATTPIPQWLLLSLPFVGRMQNQTLDATAAPPTAPSSLLRVDPLLQIDRARKAGTPIPTLPLLFASWADGADVSVGLAEFDMPRQRVLPRPEPSALRESWYRLSLPDLPTKPSAAAPLLAGVAASFTSDTPAALSRPTRLARLLDPRRVNLPPAPPPVDSNGVLTAPALLAQRITWRPDSLFVTQNGYSNIAPDSGQPDPSSRQVLARYGFFTIGVQAAQANLFAVKQPGRNRYAAVTLVPSLLSIDQGGGLSDNPQPVGFAVSPYLGMTMDQTPIQGTRLLAVAELVGTNTDRTLLTSLASQLWTDATVSDKTILVWAAATRNRMAPDSPVAVVRLTELCSSTASPGDSTELTMRYRFLIVSDSDALFPTLRPKRALPLRAEMPSLRFVEGQYGGDQAPASLAPFEAAPPQVRGVQPIHRAAGVGGSGPPWGFSALWLSVWQTDGATGVAGVADDKLLKRVWWNSTFHQVAFQTSDATQTRKILPTFFRARPIASYLPAWPRTPLPTGDELSLDTWQPVLPGGYQSMISGARPGVLFIVREHLQTQVVDPAQPDVDPLAFASGAVPCQHRMPRPVRIPDNPTATPPAVPNQDRALQTWGTFFDAQSAAFDGRNLYVASDPSDSAFLALNSGPIGVHLTLVGPMTNPPSGTTPIANPVPIVQGTIPPNWDGRLAFRPTDTNWTYSVQLVDGATALSFSRADQASEPGAMIFKADDATALQKWLASKSHGSTAMVSVAVSIPPAPVGVPAPLNVQNFHQTLSFPLRVAVAGQDPLPLQPTFVLFEDPEYNRLLSSLTAHASASFKQAGAAGTATTYTVSFATDRREYNTTGSINYIYYLESIPAPNPPVVLGGATLRIFSVSTDGAKTPLTPSASNLPPIPMLPKAIPTSLPGSSGVLTDILTIRGGGQLGGTLKSLSPGDKLQFELTFDGAQQPQIVLLVDIVAEPVTPALESGFALLRGGSGGIAPVECVRFAWGPAPDRIELVNPDDLMTEVVRRRAVFHWSDTIRVGQKPSYAIQKIAPFGSTHFPKLHDLPELTPAPT